MFDKKENRKGLEVKRIEAFPGQRKERGIERGI